MNRIIKFRAQRTDTNDYKNWIYGNYFRAPLTIENFGCGFLSTPEQKKLDCIESDGVVYSIKLDTLGQFTGLLDKNGKEIYEGDIVEGFNTRMRYEIIFDEYEDSHAQYIGFKLKCYDKENNNKPYLTSWVGQVNQTLLKQENRFRIIGNIFDNPELLKK